MTVYLKGALPMLRKHLEIIPAHAGWHVLSDADAWMPIVGWRLSFNPDDPDCDHSITLPVVFGAWSPDDGYAIKAPDGQIGYVHNFDIEWAPPDAGTEQDRISACKAALQNAEWGEQFEASRRQEGTQQ
jgi:hypothetical protein